MKSTMSIIGILCIFAGILTLTYQGITYTKQEKILQIGDVNVTADTQKTVYFPPMLGSLCIVAGIVLVIAGRR